MMVDASYGTTPYKKLRNTLPAEIAATTPMPTPIPSRMTACRNTSLITLTARRAQRHTKPNIARALADVIGEQTVDSGNGDQQRRSGEDPQQAHGQRLAAQRSVDQILHGANVHHSQIGI